MAGHEFVIDSGKVFVARDGSLISLSEWGTLSDVDSYVRVALTGVTSHSPRPSAIVSTTWKGLRSLVFETAVLDADAWLEGDVLDLEKRMGHATEEEALAHHEDVVRQLRCELGR